MKNVIFTTYFVILSQESQQNLMWKVVISSNLNPPLKLFFYSSILANNNLLFKIYCKNIVVAFLILYTIFPFNFIRTFFFLHHTRIPTLTPFFFFFYLIPYLSLSLSLSLFLLDSRTLSSSLCDKKQRKNKQEISCLLHR